MKTENNLEGLLYYSSLILNDNKVQQVLGIGFTSRNQSYNLPISIIIWLM